ncbi:MAG: S-layer homology domain-containing protein [Patescibacteria group bacterium]
MDVQNPVPTPIINPETSEKRTKILGIFVVIIIAGLVSYFFSQSSLFRGTFLTPGSEEEAQVKDTLKSIADNAESAEYEMHYQNSVGDENLDGGGNIDLKITGKVDFTETPGVEKKYHIDITGTGSGVVVNDTSCQIAKVEFMKPAGWYYKKSTSTMPLTQSSGGDNFAIKGEVLCGKTPTLKAIIGFNGGDPSEKEGIPFDLTKSVDVPGVYVFNLEKAKEGLKQGLYNFKFVLSTEGFETTKEYTLDIPKGIPETMTLKSVITGQNIEITASKNTDHPDGEYTYAIYTSATLPVKTPVETPAGTLTNDKYTDTLADGKSRYYKVIGLDSQKNIIATSDSILVQPEGTCIISKIEYINSPNFVYQSASTLPLSPQEAEKASIKGEVTCDTTKAADPILNVVATSAKDGVSPKIKINLKKEAEGKYSFQESTESGTKEEPLNLNFILSAGNTDTEQAYTLHLKKVIPKEITTSHYEKTDAGIKLSWAYSRPLKEFPGNEGLYKVYRSETSFNLPAKVTGDFIDKIVSTVVVKELPKNTEFGETTWTDTGATDNSKNYHYFIAAFEYLNSEKIKQRVVAISDELSGTNSIELSTVTTEGNVKLSWKVSKDPSVVIKKYTIYRSTVHLAPFISTNKIGEVLAGGKFEYNDALAEEDVYYRVLAINEDEENPVIASNEAYVKSSLLPGTKIIPKEITSFTGTRVETGVNLQWTYGKPAAEFLGYKIYRSESPWNLKTEDIEKFIQDQKEIKNLLSTEKSWADTGASDKEKDYYYMVIAFNSKFKPIGISDELKVEKGPFPQTIAASATTTKGTVKIQWPEDPEIMARTVALDLTMIPGGTISVYSENPSQQEQMEVQDYVLYTAASTPVSKDPNKKIVIKWPRDQVLDNYGETYFEPVGNICNKYYVIFAERPDGTVVARSPEVAANFGTCAKPVEEQPAPQIWKYEIHKSAISPVSVTGDPWVIIDTGSLPMYLDTVPSGEKAYYRIVVVDQNENIITTSNEMAAENAIAMSFVDSLYASILGANTLPQPEKYTETITGSGDIDVANPKGPSGTLVIDDTYRVTTNDAVESVIMTAKIVFSLDSENQKKTDITVTRTESNDSDGNTISEESKKKLSFVTEGYVKQKLLKDLKILDNIKEHQEFIESGIAKGGIQKRIKNDDFTKGDGLTTGLEIRGESDLSDEEKAEGITKVLETQDLKRFFGGDGATGKLTIALNEKEEKAKFEGALSFVEKQKITFKVQNFVWKAGTHWNVTNIQSLAEALQNTSKAEMAYYSSWIGIKNENVGRALRVKVDSGIVDLIGDGKDLEHNLIFEGHGEYVLPDAASVLVPEVIDLKVEKISDTATDKTVKVTWNIVDSEIAKKAKSFYLYRSTQKPVYTSEEPIFKTDSLVSNTHTQKLPNTGESYYYKVIAKDKLIGEAGASAIATSSEFLKSGVSKAIALTWEEEESEKIDVYNIYQSSKSDVEMDEDHFLDIVDVNASNSGSGIKKFKYIVEYIAEDQEIPKKYYKIQAIGKKDGKTMKTFSLLANETKTVEESFSGGGKLTQADTGLTGKLTLARSFQEYSQEKTKGEPVTSTLQLPIANNTFEYQFDPMSPPVPANPDLSWISQNYLKKTLDELHTDKILQRYIQKENSIYGLMKKAIKESLVQKGLAGKLKKTQKEHKYTTTLENLFGAIPPGFEFLKGSEQDAIATNTVQFTVDPIKKQLEKIEVVLAYKEGNQLSFIMTNFVMPEVIPACPDGKYKTAGMTGCVDVPAFPTPANKTACDQYAAIVASPDANLSPKTKTDMQEKLKDPICVEIIGSLDLQLDTKGDRVIKIKWVDIPGTSPASSYLVYRFEGAVFDFAKAQSVAQPKEKTDFTETMPLVNGKTYQYMVTAIDAENKVLRFSNVLPIPLPGIILTNTVVDKEVKLAWTDTTAGIDKYKIFRSEDIASKGTEVVALGKDAKTHNDTPANPASGKTYYYSVVGTDIAGIEMALSNQISAAPVAIVVDCPTMMLDLKAKKTAFDKSPTAENAKAYNDAYALFIAKPCTATPGVTLPTSLIAPVVNTFTLSGVAAEGGNVNLSWEDTKYDPANIYYIYRGTDALTYKEGDNMLGIPEVTNVQGKTNQQTVPTVNKDYYYVMALLDANKKIIRISNNISIKINYTPPDNGSVNLPVGGGGISTAEILALLKAKQDAEAFQFKIQQFPQFHNVGPSPFVDLVPQMYGYDAIMRLSQAGVIEGYKKQGKFFFEPQKPVNRAEAAKLVLAAACVDVSEAAKRPPKIFKDVEPSLWFFKYTKEAYFQGYFSGYKNKVGPPTFKASSKITRAELVKVLVQVLRRGGVINVPSIQQTAPWWIPFMQIGLQVQLTTTEEAMYPTEPLTRAQTAVMVDRVKQIYNGCQK